MPRILVVRLMGLVGLIVPFLLSCAGLVTDSNVLRDANGDSIGSGCSVRYFRSADHLDERCELLGKVDLEDRSSSTDCGSGRIRQAVTRAACEIGGDVAVVKRTFDAMKFCIDAQADIYLCSGGGGGE